MSVPGKVLYLDCLVLGRKTFQISWGLPLVSSWSDSVSEEALTKSNMGKVDPSVSHVIIQYIDQGEVCNVKVETSPYIFEGDDFFSI